MKIKLTESKLKQIVAESVKKVISEARKPSDRTVGKHTLKGLRYDKNGNPLYTSDTMSDDEKKNQGWKFSKKHGMYGQLSDPTKLSESSIDLDENYGVQNNNAQKENLPIITQQFQTIESIVRNMRKQFDMAMRNGRPLNQMSSWIGGPKMIQSAIMQIISNMQM